MAVGDGFSGTVVSGGPGDTYIVNIVGVGNESCVCKQIHADETIPPGTGVLVVQTGSPAYKFQVPVFLGSS